MTMPNPIRVVIVDDHVMVRRGLAAFLEVEADLQLVGEASNGQEAVAVCEQVQPDVILMDLVMPEMNGTAATRIIRQRWPQVQVVALTSFKERDLVQGALEAGAIGYLLKNVSTDELAEAIRAAHAGEPTLAPEAVQILALAERLERLARALIDAPPDASTLPELLAEHVPGMFPYSRIEIRVFPARTLLHYPDDGPLVAGPVWEWLHTESEVCSFLPGAPLPWGDTQPASEALIMVPIVDIAAAEAIGGLYILRYRDTDAVADLLPAAQALAVQVASVLHGAQVHDQMLTQQRVARELALAGQIQASFLPDALPEVPGWQLSALLEPARETSGDFYDFIPLSEGRLGLLIADVADKGIGAALYMALCRTLIRTYAAEYDTRPDLVFGATNRRILTDARAYLFVTAFYGILDPVTGLLTYCNAGHNPPYLLHRQDGGAVTMLRGTGMALGVIQDMTWRQDTVQLAPGDLLLLYTDGITEAQDQKGEFFGETRLLEVAQANLGRSAQGVQDALIAEVHEFVGRAPQFDDITLMAVVRDT
ncbi:MAG: SpoIIE family protein phosphatase [Anaerolineae bacterium]|nr:MAG: SpoIIE family protein phosphatase [Anaerolineae bacterium]